MHQEKKLLLQIFWKEDPYLYSSDFSLCRKLVKVIVNSDILRCLKYKYIDDNLKSQPKQFWEYMALIRKKINSTSVWDWCYSFGRNMLSFQWIFY
jgi:hypothetical protein